MKKNGEGEGGEESGREHRQRLQKTTSNSHESWFVPTKKTSPVPMCLYMPCMYYTSSAHTQTVQGTGLYSVLPANLAELAMLCAG